jgi:very-short-patch-repair endonuclease
MCRAGTNMNRQKKIKYLKRRGDHYREASMLYATGQSLPKITKAENRKQDCQRKATPEKLQFASRMRQHMTPAEQHLWFQLKKLWPVFSAQDVIFGYISDFCSFQHKLIIEVDGEVHDGRGEYDRERDFNLSKRGYKTLRFSNDRVLNDRQAVLGEIMEAL